MTEGGQNIKKMEEQGNSVILTYIGAAIFIFLFLAALYESFLDPIIVLPTIFLAFTGGYLGLLMSGGSVTNNTPLATLTISGLIVKHGIMIVDVANRFMREGCDSHDAVLNAMHERLRPIMMTTVAMILGMISLLTDNGVQAVMKQEMAIFVISGMIFGTLMTIFVVPCVYVVLKTITPGGSVRKGDK